MNTFFRFFYEFISVFFEGLFLIFKGFIDGIIKMFRISDYQKIINGYKESFTGASWVFVAISIGVLVIILGLVGFLIFFSVKRIFRIKRRKVADEDLLDEIGKLNNQVRTLMDEKEKLLAMKVSQLGLKPDESPTEEIVSDGDDSEEEITDKRDPARIRFSKLDSIDQENKGYKAKKYDNNMTLEELVDNFRAFAASKLKLYYDSSLLRVFFSGLACGKLIILQGISGTGKTSLAYAWGKFVSRDSCIASVQPSWRDKTELLGYFNEFTKKFNETEVLAELYYAMYNDDVHTIVLDEMNIARVEYYFAEMLSILEMPSRDEWIIEIVPSYWPEDPIKLDKGKLKIPPNMWYIGTINNDDSTFMVTDKVYDRAMPIDIDSRIDPFKSREQEAIEINASYLESLFKQAIEVYPMSDVNIDKIAEMDLYVIQHFRVAFGNRIMKQMKEFVPVYVACGGEELEAIDYFVAKKIFRKFEQLNILLIRDEIDPFISYLNKEFGRGVMKECIAYLERIKKSA